MSGLFGGGMVNETARISALRFQTSCYGGAVPVVIGTQRCTGNVIYYGDLKAVRHEQEQGGKGGGEVTNVWYTYRYSLQIGICEGPVSVDAIWMLNGDKKSRLDQTNQYSYAIYQGDTPNIWNATLAARHPDQFFKYPGLANLTALDMGEFSGDTPPSFSFEVKGFANDDSLGGADPANAINLIVTDPRWGAAAPSSSFPIATGYGDYAVAMGWSIGLELAEQRQAFEWVQYILDQTNASAVWAADHLEIIPHGDTAVSGNGRTWSPNLTPAYDLNDDHFLNADEPVRVARKASTSAANIQAVEFRNAANEYNLETIEGDDPASVAMYGARKSNDTIKAHGLRSSDAAKRLATIKVQRGQATRNEYEFELPWTFCRLLPMDIVTLTDDALGMDRYPVRLTKVVENENLEIHCTAEDFLAGAGHVAAMPTQGSSGYSKDSNADPGASVTPVFYEPPVALSGRPELWLGTAGGDMWGGCNVWVSLDDVSYSAIGRITAKARFGLTTTAFQSASDPDETTVLGVNMAASGGILSGCSIADRDGLANLSVCGNELISFGTATLTGADTYNISSIRRGVYGTPVASETSGKKFMRLDSAVFKFAYDQAHYGKTIYIKLQSFNLFGAGQADLSTLTPHSHTIVGFPLQDITGLAVVGAFDTTTCTIKWDRVDGATGYTVEVYTGGVLRRSVVITNTLYAYTAEAAQSDGGLSRSLTFRVRAEGLVGSSSWKQLDATNTQIGAPVNVGAEAGYGSLVVHSDTPTDSDYQGTIIWSGTSNGFPINDAAILYDGPDTGHPIKSAPGVPVWFRMAHYDVFGKDNLTLSGYFSATALDLGGVPRVTSAPGSTYLGADVVYSTDTGSLYSWTGITYARAQPQVVANQITSIDLKAISATVGSLLLGDMVLDSFGKLRTQGATGYADGNGIWAGYDSGQYKIRARIIGGGGFEWTGSAFNIYDAAGNLTMSSGVLTGNALSAGFGGNWLTNTELVGGVVEPWVLGWNPDGAVISPLMSEIERVPTGDWVPPGVAALVIEQIGRTSGATADLACDIYQFGWFNTGPACQPGDRHEYHALIAAHRCDVQLILGYLDSSGNWIGEANSGVKTRAAGGNSLSGWAHLGVITTAPAGAARVFAAFRKFNTDAGQTNSYAWIAKPFFSQATANQTEFSEYHPGSPAGALAAIDQITPANVSTYIAAASIGSAEVGNLQSNNYAAGAAGWRIAKDGTAEFRNVVVRGDVQATSLNAATGTFAGALSAATGSFGNVSVAGTVTVSTTGAVMGGQTAYDTGDGFFLGYTAGLYKFGLRNGSDFLRWGTAGLEYSGRVTNTRPFAYGDIVVASSPVSRSSTTTSYYLAKAITANRAGEVRLKAVLKTSGGTAYLRFAKNGTYIGTERTTTSTAGEEFQINIPDIDPGDSMEAWIKSSGSGSTITTISSFRLCSDYSDVPAVVSID